jgi:hypothetical protein
VGRDMSVGPRGSAGWFVGVGWYVGDQPMPARDGGKAGDRDGCAREFEQWDVALEAFWNHTRHSHVCIDTGRQMYYMMNKELPGIQGSPAHMFKIEIFDVSTTQQVVQPIAPMKMRPEDMNGMPSPCSQTPCNALNSVRRGPKLVSARATSIGVHPSDHMPLSP